MLTNIGCEKAPFESILSIQNPIQPIYFPSAAGEPVENDEEHENRDGIKKEGGATIKNDKDAAAPGGTPAEKKDGQCNSNKSEKDPKEAQRTKDLKIVESEMVRDLKAQLK